MTLSFSGTPHISYSPTQGLPTAYPLTISAWYRTPTTTWTTAEAIAVFADSADGNPAFGVLLNNAGQPSATVRNASGNQVASIWGTTAFANTWYHIVGTYVSSTARTVFVNGAKGTLNSTSSTAAVSGCNSIQIARRIAAEGKAKGEIAEVGMWSAELTNAEIASLYGGLAPISVRPQNLFFYTPLVRESIELRHNHPRTVSGGPRVTEHIRVYQ